MNLEAGDQVVAYNGDIFTLEEYDCGVYIMEELDQGGLMEDDFVELNAPLRIKVDHEADAKALVERAEEAGFEFISDVKKNGIYKLNPNRKSICRQARDNNHNLTYPSDSDQILGWLSYHEDECDTCGGSGYIYAGEQVPSMGDLGKELPCPDCTEQDEQSWNEPDPSDPAWLKAYKDEAKSGRFDHHRLGLTGYSDMDLDLIDRIQTLEAERDELEQELLHIRQSFRSIVQPPEVNPPCGIEEMFDAVEDIKNERDEFRERIERAKEKVLEAKNKSGLPGHRLHVPELLHETAKILEGES